MKAPPYFPGLTVALALLSGAAGAEQAGPKADLILLHGNIYTADDALPRAAAVAVKDEKIVFVGANTGAIRFKGAKTRVIDLAGKTVLPGLTDSHCHIFGIGARELTLNLEGSNSRDGFLARVKVRADQTPPGEWITGRGWIETFWKPPEFPTRQELDRITPNNPVYLTRADGHAAVANSAALALSNIDKNTPDPFGGQILKDKATGEPTGMLLDHAQNLVQASIPKPTEAEREKALLVGIERELKLGWCEIQNAGSDGVDRRLIHQSVETGKVKIRVYNAVYGPNEEATAFLQAGATVGAFDRHFTERTIKVVFDGALGSRGAALLKPYSDAPETSGYLTTKPEDLRPMLKEALRKGIQVETHAIGDRANREILDLYQEAFDAVLAGKRKTLSGGRSSATPGSRELAPPRAQEVRWRVEHAQILDPADLPRFARMGVIPSMQPSHAISDLFFAPARLGLERLKGAYAWNSLIKTGCMIAAGSDAPVERGEPMIEFYAAVTRKSIKGESGEGWHPEEKVSREQALKMLTLWPAYAAFEEREKGTIEVGKLADFTVLSADIMKIPEPEILKTKCLMTIVGGEVVFDELTAALASRSWR